MNQPSSTETDITAAQAPPIVRAGGGAVLASGALVLLVALQTFTGFILPHLWLVWTRLPVRLPAGG
jgi:hypothetical protein